MCNMSLLKKQAGNLPQLRYSHLCHKPRISFVEFEIVKLYFSEVKNRSVGPPNSFGYFKYITPNQQLLRLIGV